MLQAGQLFGPSLESLTDALHFSLDIILRHDYAHRTYIVPQSATVFERFEGHARLGTNPTAAEIYLRSNPHTALVKRFPPMARQHGLAKSAGHAHHDGCSDLALSSRNASPRWTRDCTSEARGETFSTGLSYFTVLENSSSADGR